jgi:hypothetical protein
MFVRQWVIPIFAFAVITAWWLFPILSNLSGAIPGTGAGDNVTFVWNEWWMRYVLHHPGQTFFFTPFLFFPVGVDLTLHTHTALPALLGAAVASPIAGQNLLIVVHIALNFVCMYALAHRATGQVVSSFAAAVIFGTSAFVSAHLRGHFNLIAAWMLPLVSLLMINALERPTATRGLLVGVALATAAYTDYYLFVYGIAIVFLLWLSHVITIERKEPSTSFAAGRRRLRGGLVALLIVDLFLIAAILLWPGDHLDVGAIHISLRSARNPITIAWILLLMIAASVAFGRIRVQMNVAAAKPYRRVLLVASVFTMVAVMPLLIHAERLWRAGNYVSQAYLWRSGPSGVDVATVVVANPFHAIWGDAVRGLYERRHIDVIESSASVPLSAIALVVVAFVLRRRRNKGLTPWVLIGAVFTTWALGPWLMVAGGQSPLILPTLLIRFIPIVSNARIPGRAMVVVYLAIAMLAAFGFERLTAGGRTARRAAWCLLLLLIIECIPAPPPVYVPDMPSSYAALRDASKAGAVCELPMGLRDGFGETGSLDEAVLLHQIIHERPIVGGFVARLPPSVARSYNTMPVIRSFLQLSAGGQIAPEDISLTPPAAAAALANAGIAYVVLDRRRAGPALVRYVQSGITLRQIREQDGRVFYEVPSR